MKELLASRGFGNLIGADTFNLWGTSYHELIKTDEVIPETSFGIDPHPKVIDLRLYAGYYTVVHPPQDKGEQFMVHPTLGSIRMARKD